MKHPFQPWLAICGGLAILAGALPARGENPEFRARLASWRQPRAVAAAPPLRVEARDEYYEEVAPDFASDGYGPSTCDGSCGGTCGANSGRGGCGGMCGLGGMHRDPGCSACLPCRKPRWWLRSDALLWWRKGRDLPVLLTSATTPNEPIGTTVLYGDEIESGPPQVGGRIDFGTWLDWDECVGIGGRFWGLGKERTRFHADSDTFPDQTIERPHIDEGTGEDSVIISDPFLGVVGTVDVVTTSEVLGADAYARLHWCGGCDIRIDLIGGYQFTRINEELSIVSSSESPEATVDAGDQWLTRNEFHGGTIGLLWESCHGCWTTTILTKVGLGTMRQTVKARGFENDLPIGLLVEEATTVTRDEFCAVPEIDVKLAWQVNPCWSLHGGYSFIYWSNVARPEAMIDPIVGNDTSVIFRDSSFWVQGITLGATCRF